MAKYTKKDLPKIKDYLFANYDKLPDLLGLDTVSAIGADSPFGQGFYDDDTVLEALNESKRFANVQSSVQFNVNSNQGLRDLDSLLYGSASRDAYQVIQDTLSQFIVSPQKSYSYQDPSFGNIGLYKSVINGNKVLNFSSIVSPENVDSDGRYNYETSLGSKSSSNSGIAKKVFRLISSTSSLPVVPDIVVNPRIQRIFEKSGNYDVLSDPFGITRSYIPKGLEYQRQDISQEGKQGFEYGQKFQSPRTGESASLVTSDGKTAVIQNIAGKQKIVPVSTLKEELQIKSPASLTDLRRGDGLIVDSKGSQFNGQRYTVIGSDPDRVKLRSESGSVSLVPKDKIASNFRANPLGFGTFPALTSSLLGATGIVGGATAGKLLAKSLGANEDQQNIAAGVGGALGGVTGTTLGFLGDGAKIPMSFQDMARSALAARRDSARQGFNSESGMVTSNKKINSGSVSTSVTEPNRPKLTSDIIADYLDRMGGQATLVKPDGTQYSPDRKSRVIIGDRMTTAERFAQAADVGLTNEYQKLPEVHARFDDRQVALQVQKEIATGRLTTQKFYEVPTKEVANQVADEIRRSPELLGRGENVEVRKRTFLEEVEGDKPISKTVYEVVAVKQYQPIPSRGNTIPRTYGMTEQNALRNDPTGIYVAFNKPEEAYSAPKSLKELQSEIKKQNLQLSNAYKELGATLDMAKADFLRSINPIREKILADDELAFKAKIVLDDIRARASQPQGSNWEKLQIPSMPEPVQQMMQMADSAEPVKAIASKLETSGDRIGGYQPKQVSKILEVLGDEDTYRSVLGAMSIADQDRFNSGLQALEEGNKFGNRDLLETLNRARRNTPNLGGDMYAEGARQAFSKLDDALGVKFGFNETLNFGLKQFANSSQNTFRVDIPDQAKLEISRTKVDGKTAFRVDNIVAYNSEAMGDRFAMKTLKYLQEKLPKPVVMGNVINEKFARIFEKQGYVRQGNDFLPPELAPKQAIAPNTARDTGGWANAVGEPFAPPRSNSGIVDIRKPNFAAEMGLETNPTGLSDRGYYNKVAATYADDNFGLGDRLKPFPEFYDLVRESKAEGVRPEAMQNYIKGRANAPLIESGIMKAPELPMTARLGQEYISPKTGAIGTVESVGKKGVKLNVDGQVVPVEYKTLERLKYTGNKGFGFATPAALRPIVGGFAGGTVGSALFKQLAKSAGLNEEQQNQASITGGLIGSFGGSALVNASANTRLRVPTAREFAQTMVSTPQQRSAGARLFDLASNESPILSQTRANILNNKLPQYDIKPVLGEAVVIATDMLSPSPYGVATVPAMRTTTELWQQNFDDVSKKGAAGLVNRNNITGAIAKTKSLKDLTYQSLTAIAKGAGLPFPMTEQIIGNVVDQIPTGEQVMGMADRAKRIAQQFGFGFVDTQSGLLSMEQRQKALEFNQQYDRGAIVKESYNPKRSPMQKLTLDESAATMGMTTDEYRYFQERAYKEFGAKPEPSSGSKKPPKYVEPARFATDSKTGDRYDMQSFREANKQWRRSTDEATRPLREVYDQAIKSGDKELQKAAIEAIDEVKLTLPPAPVKADFIAPLDKPVKIGDRKVFSMGALSESAIQARRSQRKSSGGFGKKSGTFIAESAIEAAAKSTGASTQQVKAQIASQRTSGQTVDLGKATEMISTARQSKELAIRPTQSKELAVRSLPEIKSQSKELSTRVLSRQQPDGMMVVPSQSMIDAGMKQQNRVRIGDRIGASGIGFIMDTAQAAQVLTDATSRGEKAPVALGRAALSVGAGYATTAAASFIPNPYLRTAAQVGLGIAAVVGADKAIDQIVGRDAARESKYAKDLSKLDLQPINERDQVKPFANDSNLLAAYGNSLTAQIQSNLDYRPAARSLANLANSKSIDNARYASERGQSIETNQALGAGRRNMSSKSGKSIVYRDLEGGGTQGIMRDRPLTDKESRILAMQNLVNESGLEVDRTGKFDGKTFEALEKLGYSQRQVRDYIDGKTKVIGKPQNKGSAPNQQSTSNQTNQQSGKAALAVRSQLGKVTSADLSAALSAERQKLGLKGGQTLSDQQVNTVFKSLTNLRQNSGKVGNVRSGLSAGVGIGS